MKISAKLLALAPPIDFLREFCADKSTELSIFLSFYKITSESGCNGIGDEDEVRQSLLLVTALKDRMWEVINTGHYSNVDKYHQQLFTLSTFCKVVLDIQLAEAAAGGMREVFEQCDYDLDYGLLLGRPLDGEAYSALLTDCLKIIKTSKEAGATAEDEGCSTVHAEAVRDASTTPEIPFLKCPSIEVFHQNHFVKRQPAILSDCMTHWPALKKWSNPQYLIKVAGERLVPIEIGMHYTDDDWSQDLVKLEDFIRRHFLSEAVIDRKEYLAQHSLFDQIPDLKKDISIPDYCCLTDDETSSTELQVDVKAWLGPSGTISPMHHDPKHNLLCQVFGHKRIILAAPEDTPSLYPHEDQMLFNTSQIDAENLDFEAFPLTRSVKFFTITLFAGEMLYIPPTWWHYVRSLDKSFSVSFWWD